MDLSAIQAALRESRNDCWLFYDHHHRDPISYHLLGLPEKMLVSRRWFYVVPADGEPVKLVHRIESHHLDSLPGSKMEYSAWQELWQNLEAMLKPYHNVVMQYSPNNQIPYISLVDARHAGTGAQLRQGDRQFGQSGRALRSHADGGADGFALQGPRCHRQDHGGVLSGSRTPHPQRRHA